MRGDCICCPREPRHRPIGRSSTDCSERIGNPPVSSHTIERRSFILRNLCVVNRSVIRLLILVVVAATSTSLTAGVVGSGTPTSCTQSALQAQLSAGGTVTFNCGAGQQTISITSPLGVLSSFPPVTIDGNDTMTLDGTGTTSGMLNVYGSDTALGTLTLKHI